MGRFKFVTGYRFPFHNTVENFNTGIVAGSSNMGKLMYWIHLFQIRPCRCSDKPASVIVAQGDWGFIRYIFFIVVPMTDKVNNFVCPGTVLQIGKGCMLPCFQNLGQVQDKFLSPKADLNSRLKTTKGTSIL